jgi:hypothetical protein
VGHIPKNKPPRSKGLKGSTIPGFDKRLKKRISGAAFFSCRQQSAGCTNFSRLQAHFKQNMP